MSDKVKCEYCEHEFTNKFILATHQKRAKYCIKIQQDKNIEVKEDLFRCEYCDLTCSPTNAARHMENCRAKLVNKLEEAEDLIEKQRIEILRLNDELAIYKERSNKITEKTDIPDKRDPDTQTTNNTVSNNTVTNGNLTVNNTTNNIQHVTKNTIINNFSILNLGSDDITDKVNGNFTLEHLKTGVGGLLDFLLEHVLTDNEGRLKYGCTDLSRQIFKYKDTGGNITEDPKARKLFKAVQKPLADKASKLYEPLGDDINYVHLGKHVSNIGSLSHEKSCPRIRNGLARRTKI